MIPDPYGTAPGLPDEAFDSDGLLTKRHVRASALAVLRPRPGEVLWDLGAGAGSVGIEWARADPTCRAVGVERDAVRAARARGNAERLGVAERVRIVEADLRDGLAALPAPDAVFVGGGVTREVVDAAWAALPAGGRLVLHGVTLEAEALLVDCHRAWGGALVRLAVETAAPIGGLLGWTPARAVVQWSGTKG